MKIVFECLRGFAVVMERDSSMLSIALYDNSTGWFHRDPKTVLNYMARMAGAPPEEIGGSENREAPFRGKSYHLP